MRHRSRALAALLLVGALLLAGTQAACARRVTIFGINEWNATTNSDGSELVVRVVTWKSWSENVDDVTVRFITYDKRGVVVTDSIHRLGTLFHDEDEFTFAVWGVETVCSAKLLIVHPNTTVWIDD